MDTPEEFESFYGALEKVAQDSEEHTKNIVFLREIGLWWWDAIRNQGRREHFLALTKALFGEDYILKAEAEKCFLDELSLLERENLVDAVLGCVSEKEVPTFTRYMLDKYPNFEVHGNMFISAALLSRGEIPGVRTTIIDYLIQHEDDYIRGRVESTLQMLLRLPPFERDKRDKRFLDEEFKEKGLRFIEELNARNRDYWNAMLAQFEGQLV